jgi:CRISPR-associated protein Cas5d
MLAYPLQLELSGPIALWARPDTGSSPVSYIAPTFSAVKGIFEASLRWKSVNVRPTCCGRRCPPPPAPAPDYAGPFRDGTALCATENHVIPAFLEMVFNRPQNARNRSLN